jgi:ribosomal protein L37AE/L43A
MFGLYGKDRRLNTRESTGRILRGLAQQHSSKKCPACDDYVLAVCPYRSRGTNLLLTICTLGLWTVVWAYETVRYPGWRCNECGHQL